MNGASYPAGPLCTRDSIAKDLRRLGLKAGDSLLLHSSLRSIGWVSGGPETVVLALLDVIGAGGTLVVPTQTEINSDPINWKTAPRAVLAEWHEKIRASMPAFNPKTTPSSLMGAIAETVRTWPGSIRSASPQSSFAAVGASAEHLMADHPLECRLGEDSPLAKLEQADARVLLLGVGFMKCTCLHLAEYRTDQPRGPVSFAAFTPSGDREWMTVDDVLLNGDGFDALGADLEKTGKVAEGFVGAASSKLFALKDAVAFAEEWLPVNRPVAGSKMSIGTR